VQQLALLLQHLPALSALAAQVAGGGIGSQQQQQNSNLIIPATAVKPRAARHPPHVVERMRHWFDKITKLPTMGQRLQISKETGMTLIVNILVRVLFTLVRLF
jgi:hypothetical protein